MSSWHDFHLQFLLNQFYEIIINVDAINLTWYISSICYIFSAGLCQILIVLTQLHCITIQQNKSTSGTLDKTFSFVQSFQQAV